MTPTQCCIHTFRAAELSGAAHNYTYARSDVNQALSLTCCASTYHLQEPIRIEQDLFSWHFHPFLLTRANGTLLLHYIEMNTIPGFNTFQMNSLLWTILLRPFTDRCCMGVTQCDPHLPRPAAGLIRQPRLTYKKLCIGGHTHNYISNTKNKINKLNVG